MGQKWKGTVEARKLRFLELYEAGASRSMLMNELGMVRHDVDDWCYTIRIFGASQFLMSHTSKTHYSYETKLAAVKARLEDQIPYQDIMARYGVAPKLLRTSWPDMVLHPSFSAGGAKFSVSRARLGFCQRKRGVR